MLAKGDAELAKILASEQSQVGRQEVSGPLEAPVFSFRPSEPVLPEFLHCALKVSLPLRGRARATAAAGRRGCRGCARVERLAIRGRDGFEELPEPRGRGEDVTTSPTVA